MCICSQASVLCTTTRAKKVVVSLTLVTLISVAVLFVFEHVLRPKIWNVVSGMHHVIIHAVVPATILIINLIVVYKVRRSSHYAATNLGLQRHHQSTSSSSSVPTVTLVTTSLVYVALCGTWSMFHLISLLVDQRSSVYVTLNQWYHLSAALVPLVFAYNFFIYLITSKQFRSQLHKFVSCCLSPCSSFPAVTSRTST